MVFTNIFLIYGEGFDYARTMRRMEELEELGLINAFLLSSN